jgi:hypothetical protein
MKECHLRFIAFGLAAMLAFPVFLTSCGDEVEGNDDLFSSEGGSLSSSSDWKIGDGDSSSSATQQQTTQSSSSSHSSSSAQQQNPGQSSSSSASIPNQEELKQFGMASVCAPLNLCIQNSEYRTEFGLMPAYNTSGSARIGEGERFVIGPLPHNGMTFDFIFNTGYKACDGNTFNLLTENARLTFNEPCPEQTQE